MMKLKGQSRMQISRPNANVIMGCELDTSLTDDELKRGLEKLSKGHPIMNKVPSIDDSGNVILEDPKEIGFTIMSYQNRNYESIAENHLKDEWKFGEPLIKFIINKQEIGCQLIICCNHTICDGLSLVYLMEDIANWLQDGQTPQKAELVQLHPYQMKKRYATWPFKLIAFLMKSKWRKHNVQLTSKSLSELYESYWKNHNAKVSNLTFNREQTKNIIETAKNNKVTVNTYLTYWLHKSQMSLPEKKYSDNIILSVNLRDKLKTNPMKQLGYFVTATRLNLSKYSLSRVNALKDLQNRINKCLTPKNLFKTLALYFFDGKFFDLLQLNILKLRQDKSFEKMAAKHSSVKSSMAISNLGVLSNKNNLVTFLPLVLVSDTYEKYVSVFTHNGQIKMAICYDPNIISTAEIDTFKNSLIEKIKTTANNVYKQ